MSRIPEMIIFGLIQPIMFVVLFSYVFGGSMQIGDSTSPAVYREFLMAGIFAQTVTFATAGAGAGIADDMHKGLIDRFRSLPMARGAVLTGRTLADLVQTTLTPRHSRAATPRAGPRDTPGASPSRSSRLRLLPPPTAASPDRAGDSAPRPAAAPPAPRPGRPRPG
ncbi:hypothetical protein STANM309S_00176 [Streptomyces tanashiensis]